MPRDNQYRLLWSNISRSKKLKACNGSHRFRRDCHFVFTWLIAWQDDDGRIRGELSWLISNIFPFEYFSTNELKKILLELHRVGLIIWYDVDYEKYIQIVEGTEHQRIRKDRHKPSIYPPPNQMSTNRQPCDNQLTTKRQPPRSPISSSIPSPLSTLPEKDSFEIFWTKWPGPKVGKMKAEEKWSVKAKNKRLPDLQIILAALDKQKRWHENPTKGEFIPPWKHPPTWIYNECWNDEVPDRTTITSQEDPFAFCPNCKKEVEKSSIVDGKCNHCTDRGEIPKEIRELTRGIG